MIDATARQIAGLHLAEGQNLLIVDADEVLVHFALPFGKWLEPQGWDFQLREYWLDTAISRAGKPARPQKISALIAEFIASHTISQPATPGAIETMQSLSRLARIVVLTNVPLHKLADRQANLSALGLNVPVIGNVGPKGPALAELSRRARGLVAFVDDSAEQIASAAEHAPDILRIQFTGCDLVRSVLPPAPQAQHQPGTWRQTEGELRQFFD